jgi:hypothetical protein
MKALDIITNEIHDYLYGTVDIGDGIKFSENKLKRRINFYKNRYQQTGKIVDGDYQYWYDLMYPLINSEVKNLRIDSKYIMVWSKSPIVDFAPVYIANAKNAEYMEETGRADELAESVEDFAADGNVLFSKALNGYERCDMQNTYIINQSARTVEDTAIIERWVKDANWLKQRKGIYDHVDEVIKNCGNKFFSRIETNRQANNSQTKFYEIHKRTGILSEKDYLELKGDKTGSEDRFVFTIVITAGLRKGSNADRYILLAEDITGDKMTDWYTEAHRGAYKGRWWREGLVELLMDHQTRYNDLTNQIARALDIAMKVVFRSADLITINNARVAIDNGDILRSEDLSQIDLRVHNLDQAISDRNAALQDAQRVANAFEVVTGESLPSGTPFKLGMLQDVNANKLYTHLRKKLAIPYRRVYRNYVLPELVKKLKGEDIIKLTGDGTMLSKFNEIVANSWYWKNILKIGPHAPEQKDLLIKAKVAELSQMDPLIKNMKEIWEGVLPRLFVTIVGENYNLEEQQTIINMLNYETDPVRRAFLMDYIYSSRGIPVPPAMVQGVQGSPQKSGQTESQAINDTEEGIPAVN